ncbi:hypothetical protein Poly30_09240 [Planctomycetes bacterium Poly30]|uniref:Uncharacterized protein n=1 Tax=Saltatorellus ferox TaxID=2528018 RepID=A0A518EMV8_9BACT|nr:hypothetical protein Poly30_09240 [Planctomycetes bacterium Poly30]
MEGGVWGGRPVVYPESFIQLRRQRAHFLRAAALSLGCAPPTEPSMTSNESVSGAKPTPPISLDEAAAAILQTGRFETATFALG